MDTEKAEPEEYQSHLDASVETLGTMCLRFEAFEKAELENIFATHTEQQENMNEV